MRIVSGQYRGKAIVAPPGGKTRVIGTKRDPSGYRGAADEVIAFRGRRQVFERADYLVLCIGLADETRKMINAESLAWMKPTAYFINVARGLAVDQEALVDALKTGVIDGAVTLTWMTNSGGAEEKALPEVSDPLLISGTESPSD